VIARWIGPIERPAGDHRRDDGIVVAGFDAREGLGLDERQRLDRRGYQ